MGRLACASYGQVAHANDGQGVAFRRYPLLVVQHIAKLGAYAVDERHRHQAVINLYFIACYQILFDDDVIRHSGLYTVYLIHLTDGIDVVENLGCIALEHLLTDGIVFHVAEHAE